MVQVLVKDYSRCLGFDNSDHTEEERIAPPENDSKTAFSHWLWELHHRAQPIARKRPQVDTGTNHHQQFRLCAVLLPEKHCPQFLPESLLVVNAS